MLTDKGPKVIEYNARFGDPETQCILPLLKTDLLEVMLAVTNEKLESLSLLWEDKATCLVVLASKGYPESYKSGYEIKLPENKDGIYIAGAKREGDKLLSTGGRVLGVNALGNSLKEAVAAAYERVKLVNFENKYYRTDIGKKALEV